MTPLVILSTIVELLGLAAVVFGVIMISIPAGIIVAGLVMVLIGFSIDPPLVPGKGKQ